MILIQGTLVTGVSVGCDNTCFPLVAFLLDNAVSDLSNPDCLDFHVGWNKNPQKDRSVSFIILGPLCEGPLFVYRF